MQKPTFIIQHIHSRSNARTGTIDTPHGQIQTPYLFPVGTQGSVKSLSVDDLIDIGAQAVLANTYHLHLRPGEEVIEQMGGLASFMSWNRPTMTDSGGYQVFSLGVALEHGVAKLLKYDDPGNPKPRLNVIREEGVTFRSHIDGSSHTLTPESSIHIQQKIGADLIVGFDDLESPRYDYQQTKESMLLSNRWLVRSKAAHVRKDQLLYGVVHGGEFEDLRKESARFVDGHFDAVALGGAHKDKSNMYEVIRWIKEEIDPLKPTHLLGIGEVEDLFHGVWEGIDTFDCVIPTRLGRAGHVFVSPPVGSVANRFRYDVTKSIYALDQRPLDEHCMCMVCTTYSRAYIHHLFRSRELLGHHLASYHNVYVLNHLMTEIRDALNEDRLPSLALFWGIVL